MSELKPYVFHVELLQGRLTVVREYIVVDNGIARVVRHRDTFTLDGEPISAGEAAVLLLREMPA
jgi:hypothetical protein